MAFLNPGNGGRGVPRAEINMIPLIDVMLVLLVIFMITAPLLTHAVKLELPRASSQSIDAMPKVTISIDAQDQLYWDGQRLAAGDLADRLRTLGRERPNTEIHLQADKTAHYERVSEVITSASQAGLGRIGFISRPAGS
jgi:biopolymer transport protein ExbD